MSRSSSSSSSSSSRIGSDRMRFVGEKTCVSWSSAMAVRTRLVPCCAISLALFGLYGARNVSLNMRKRTHIFSRHFAPGDHVTLRHNFRALRLFESSGRARSQKKCEEKKRANPRSLPPTSDESTSHRHPLTPEEEQTQRYASLCVSYLEMPLLFFELPKCHVLWICVCVSVCVI